MTSEQQYENEEVPWLQYHVQDHHEAEVCHRSQKTLRVMNALGDRQSM